MKKKHPKTIRNLFRLKFCCLQLGMNVRRFKIISQFLYSSFTVYIVLRLGFVDYSLVPENRKLENIPLECNSVINGTENRRKISRARQWDWHFDWVEHEIFNSRNVCSTIDKYFNFTRIPSSREEAEYPLAYGLVVYKTIVQVLTQMSLFYQPQHMFCITVDDQSPNEYKSVIQALPSCFPNMHVFIGEPSQWGSFGILKNVYTCFNWLSKSKQKWKYYQYLSGTDLPIRTNLEMVRIFKALNGSMNTDVSTFEVDRYKNMEGVLPPMPVYKSSMSVVVPREGADYLISSPRVQKLLKYLSKTWIPDESFWSTVLGSPALLPVPGSIRVRDILWLRKNFKLRPPYENTVNSIGTSYIGRYQVWGWQKECFGKVKDFSCVFGVEDIEEIMTRPELVAHKLYLEFQPAAFMCMLKEVRRRSLSPDAHLFSARSYSQMPTVELYQGKAITQLTNPNWLVRDSFYNPQHEDFDKEVL
ncbi:Core-2/I-Branching enzyme [Caenorhabditis elegans]|uniref:Core-2/I-Branching enzyme n=1 Tax=Caenorhabditis elegans TaxID=6239 RepID=G5ECK8_CAEEL|nr:Core-2/I-Branching enzyme [Caenorhabditis elegans]AAK94757.1 GLY-1 [Caenorhabditis elegans]AAK94758.1 GLY-1 [Caenorhabditis elegans]CAA85457.1 Core-2/I-Branching enzyme [Caenorhabditis elegans]|eukprot:NP_496345.1 GLYcosylation related [Caenorhabditis elegans]